MNHTIIPHTHAFIIVDSTRDDLWDAKNKTKKEVNVYIFFNSI